jgi:LPS sulfotransferase NodH
MVAPEEISFVVLSAPRTGSNLTIELLNSHPDCFSGHEIFSKPHMASGHVAWYLGDIPKDRELAELRRTDPIAFIDRLDRLTRERGYKAVGFKLMYSEADENPTMKEYLLNNRSLRVIHIKRRNHLRRLVSTRRAQVTGRWWFGQGEDRPALPPVRLSLSEIFWDMEYIRKYERAYAELSATHQVLDLWYEDMSGDLLATAQQLWRFLGLREWSTLNVHAAKTGTDLLSEAIENYDELREQLGRLHALFD